MTLLIGFLLGIILGLLIKIHRNCSYNEAFTIAYSLIICLGVIGVMLIGFIGIPLGYLIRHLG